MKIVSSDLSLGSSRSYQETHVKSENLNIWTEGKEARPNQTNVTLQISEEARRAYNETIFSVSTQNIAPAENVGETKEDTEISLLEALLSAMAGKKVRLLRPKIANTAQNTSGISGNPPSVGWGLIYDYHEEYRESEKVSFQAKGIVKTADGKEINIDLQLSMSREFMTSKEIHIRAGDALRIDPLVINFSGSSAALTDKKYSFDLDCDGTSDQISFLAQGSGFLALDLNNDGIINDGSELFGPKSGDGFKDLSAYDSDKNGWIDENDEIFDKLRIWAKDSQGNDVLFALGQKGIGAIYLGNALTTFGLKDANNNSLGEIRKTGIFLRENGSAGTVQHVDLMV